MPITRKTLVTDVVKALKQNKFAIFAGAGLSAPAGFVNWKNLLKDLAEEIGLDVEKESHDLVALAQFYVNKQGGRGKLNSKIQEEFNPLIKPTENHNILARLPIDTYWTTNYDILIEESLKKSNKLPNVKIASENLTSSQLYPDANVYKMHGDILLPDRAVLIRDDYEAYDKRYPFFREVLEGDLLSKTFLFLGFSFADPNLNYVLARIRGVLEGKQRTHYCVFKQVRRCDYNTEDTDSDEKSYNYDKIKQELQIGDLKRFGVYTLLVENHEDITSILLEIENKLQENVVFISGSCEDYEEFSDDANEAKDFIYQLSKELIHNNYKIVSGFGLGVGDYVINGAICGANEYLKSENQRKESLILKPFPQNVSEGVDIEQMWESYRQEILSTVGNIICIFGNKLDKKNGQLINAGGVQREFEIAKEKRLKIIPVGLTGYQSKKIYDEMMLQLDDYCTNTHDIKVLFDGLSAREKADKKLISNDDIIKNILDILNIMKVEDN